MSPRRPAADAFVSIRRSPTSKGVGPARAEALKRLGVVTAVDLLYHIPHRYEDASTIASIASLEPRMQGTVRRARHLEGRALPTRKGLRIFQAVLKDDTGMIEVSWPGQPFLDRTIAKGDALLVSGSVRFFHGRQLQPREFVSLGDDDDAMARDGALGVSGDGGLVQGDPRDHRRAPRRAAPPSSPNTCRRTCCAAAIARHPRRVAHGAPPVVARRGHGGARAARVRGAAVRAACSSSAPRPWPARRAAASASRTGVSSRLRSAKRCRSRSPARSRACCARSSPTCAASAACSACCKATSAAARRSWRCSARCSRWRAGPGGGVAPTSETARRAACEVDGATARAARHRAAARHRRIARERVVTSRRASRIRRRR